MLSWQFSNCPRIPSRKNFLPWLFVNTIPIADVFLIFSRNFSLRKFRCHLKTFLVCNIEIPMQRWENLSMRSTLWSNFCYLYQNDIVKILFFLFFLIILILDLTVNAKLSYKPRNLENKWFLLKTRFITLNILFVCRVKNKLDFCFFSVNISFIFFCESFSANGLADVTSGGITITKEAAKIKTGTNVFSYMAETDPENFDRVPYFILVKKQIFKTKYL